MDLIQFYQRLLNLSSPWLVTSVTLDETSGEVVVHVANDPNQSILCPIRNLSAIIYDHAPARRWRHTDTCQMQTIIECSVPRILCGKDKVQQVCVPWADAHSRCTQLFEIRAIDMMQVCPRSKASDLLSTSVDVLGRIAHRAVSRGLERKAQAREDGELPFPTQVSIDEKYWRGRRCATIIGDAQEGVVEDMISGNAKAPVKSWFQGLPEAARSEIESVTMDFLPAFQSAVEETVPGAQSKIVFDKFHLVKQANDAMEEVRRKEMAACSTSDREFRGILKKARYCLLRSSDNLKPWQEERIDVVDEWFHDTGDAYKMKESIRQILSLKSAEEVQSRLEEWIAWVRTSKLDPMKRVANLVQRCMFGILNIFHLKRSNANAESLNARIQAVRVKSRGHRSYEAFKRDVFFHLGGLDLYPTVSV
jgi:transposase